ncbi:MAG: hypothetical protein KKA81_07525 [Bacteroidetes bacterium]|nr:hypothetical protein [Bacteroidota bacterium]
MTRILFKEEQRFRQVWILFILIASAGLWLFFMIWQGINENLFTTKPEAAWITLIVGIIPVVLIFLFLKMKLITVIDQQGVGCRFTILQKSFKRFEKDDILSYEIRKYKPIQEYGGWGIRVSGGKKGTAYNVSGNMGLQLYMKNGKKFLIGTRQEVSLGRAMEKLMGKPGPE